MQIRILGNLILASTLIASAQATAVFSLGRAFAVDNLLVARQTTTCDPVAVCAVFSNAVAGCATTACICTVANANSLQSCVTCSVNTAPTTAVIDEAVQLITTFKDACSAFNLPNVQVPSSSPTTPSTTPVVPPSALPSVPSTPPATVSSLPTTPVTQTTVTNLDPSLTDNSAPMTTIGPSDLQTTTPVASTSSTVSKSSGAMTASQGLSSIVAGTVFMLFGMLLA